MGVTDGHVIGATKIIDHGPAGSCWNLVLLAEGYQVGEMAKFGADAEHFVTRMRTTAPFDTFWDSINVWRIDVASNESGADTTAAAAATYFDAKLSVSAGGYALIPVDGALVQSVADSQVADYHDVLVVVNHPDYGGSGDWPAVYSTADASGYDGADVGLHELAHQAFDLADEYSGNKDSWTGGTVDMPNVSEKSAAADVPWKDLLTAGVAIPAIGHLDAAGACTLPDPAVSPVPAGSVSVFEGAFRRHCGLFRSEFACKMRDVIYPFCAVCRQRIAATLASYIPSETDASLSDEEPGLDTGPVDRDRCCCRDLLDCLTQPPVIGRLFIQNIENLGVNWRELRRCITGHCHGHRGPF